MTKDQYRQKYISRLKALRHDIHVRHINNLEMLAKDRQEYWRRPLILVHVLLCIGLSVFSRHDLRHRVDGQIRRSC